jgi:hypothetical protein
MEHSTHPRSGIRKIYLENFQSITGPVEIELEKLTLLFGPNSAGKSAVFDAVKQFSKYLEGFYDDNNSPWKHARNYNEKGKDRRPEVAVGIEIYPSDWSVRVAKGQANSRVDDGIFDALLNGSTVDLRFIFAKHGSTVEIRVDGGEPLLSINDHMPLNFFDVIEKALPQEYVDIVSKPSPSVELETLISDDFDSYGYLGPWRELHRFLESFQFGIFSMEHHRPNIPVVGEVRLDLSHPLSSAYSWNSEPEDSLQDCFVKSIDEQTAVFRGIEWNVGTPTLNNWVGIHSDAENFFGARHKLNGEDLHSTYDPTKNAPVVFSKNPQILHTDALGLVEKLNVLFEFLVTVFRYNLNFSHVPGQRLIINSSEPIHLASNEDLQYQEWELENDDVPKWVDDLRIRNPSLSTTSSRRIRAPEPTSFAGYEFAVERYAHRIAELNDPETLKEIGSRPTELWHDFPNFALKELLPSMSRYRIDREAYSLQSHITHYLKGDSDLDETSVVYFSVRDVALGKHSEFADVGSGLSFIFPILVALGESALTFTEQPELHLHPRAQAEMADVFIAASNHGRYSVIESHSEQLLMRVSRRILESRKLGSLKDQNIERIRPELELNPSDVKIYYFDPGSDPNDGTNIIEIKFAPDGSLVDDWPTGFFDNDEVNSFSRLQLFSGNIDASNALKDWPWISKFKDNPDIVRWLNGASTALLIEDMCAVVFPLYASKIAEKLIVDKLLKPFRKMNANKSLTVKNTEGPVHDYLFGKTKRAPSLGQFTHFMRKIAKDFRSNDSPMTKEFRTFVRSLSWEGKDLLLDPKFVSQLAKLAKLRGGGAHIQDGTLNEAIEMQLLLFADGKPGPLFQAFGYQI